MTEFLSLLLAPCLIWGVKPFQESISVQTLQCYDDYKSLTTCTWMECSEAHQFLNVTLNCAHMNSTKEMSCMFHKGERHTRCQNFTMTWMCQRSLNAGVVKNCSFESDVILQTELNVYVFQSVQPLAPQNLSVSLMTSGDFLLTWKGHEGNPGLSNALEYEVAYKQMWESWEKAASLSLSSTTRCHLSHEGLVPGSRYVARVRARPGQSSGFSGQFSEWSTEASWETPEEEECSPVHEKTLPHAPYVVQSCEITVTNTSAQSQYHVAVRTKTEGKQTEAYSKIRVLPPANVSVIMRENQEYEMRWIKHTLQYGFIKQRYEVQYWKDNQYKKTLQTIDIVNDESPFIFTLQMLESSTKYRGRIRARVNTDGYHGPWSEWSEEFTWETENGTFALPASKIASQLPVSQPNSKGQSTFENIEPIICLQVVDGLICKDSADASTASQTALTCFDFNGPYLYSPVISSQPDIHRALQVVPTGIHGKSGSLQYVSLPAKEACPQAPQRQAQPGGLPLQPSLLPYQKEKRQHLSNGEEISPAQPARGKCMHVRADGQKSPVALSCPASPQQCSLDYITTDGLLLPSAKDSNHLALTTDGELASDSQDIQHPEDCSCSEFSPGKSGVLVAVSAPTSNSSPELHLDAFGDYLTVPPSPNGTSELVLENSAVLFNPDCIIILFLQYGQLLPSLTPNIP